MALQYRVAVPLILLHYLLRFTLTIQHCKQQVTGQNIQRIKVLLPAECDNQDVVQIRWISKQLSGILNRPSCH
jgi:hypothetical protein